MADLKYNSVVLETLAQDLATSTDNLKNDRDLQQVDVVDVAHRDVVSAINDFVDDWDDKRSKLTDKVEALAEMAATAKEKFSETDQELADSLTTETSGL